MYILTFNNTNSYRDNFYINIDININNMKKNFF